VGGVTGEHSVSSVPDDYERLAALERRGDELEAFSNCMKQANAYIRSEGTDALVADLRRARDERRRMKVATINCLVLLHHIDRLEAELARDPLMKP
jgi:hypothetical protein